jgi:signal transduction histidine kinase
LVKNIRVAVERVRSIKSSGDITERIGIQGVDEVAFLTNEFDKLLDQREKAQDFLIEAEKTASKVQLARVVAHNIRSPLIAIEMVIPQLFMISDRTKRVLTNSVNEIKELSEQLKSKPETVTVQASSVGLVGEQVFLPVLVEDVVNQKQIEYGNHSEVRILLVNELKDSDVFVKVPSVDLRSILSNLVNNAVESYGEAGGTVIVVLSASDRVCSISVVDTGCGSCPINFQAGRRSGSWPGPCRSSRRVLGWPDRFSFRCGTRYSGYDRDTKARATGTATETFTACTLIFQVLHSILNHILFC